MDIGNIIFWVVVVGIIFYIVSIYNGLVRLRNRYKNAFSQIDVQLKRRYDLIPNLVETAKGYMKHERETLEAVISARSGAVDASKRASADPTDPTAMKQLLAAEAGLSGALGRLFALQENYPDLKANENMMQLSEELTSTENKIAFARQAYNDSVMVYNTQIESVPDNFIAGPFNFGPATLWEIEEAIERQNIKVDFGS
jgi:LemA protein